MQDIDSLWLLSRLKSLDLLAPISSKSSAWWWDRALSFDVVVGAILTQNTKWEKVERSLENLRAAGILAQNIQNAQNASIDSGGDSGRDFSGGLHAESGVDSGLDFGLDSAARESSEQSLQNLASCNSIESLIAPSGLYRQKSARIIALAREILAEFGSFARFQDEVSREWLLERKGIGLESADSILNYACGRAVMVVDSYTARLLLGLGIEMESYDEIQHWLMRLRARDLALLYGDLDGDLAHSEIGLAQIYARYHGKIVEFSKRKLPVSALFDVDSWENGGGDPVGVGKGTGK